jgi:glycosyltransferase involved in cell wall biosynthesis
VSAPPVVSVIIPTWRRPELVRRAIASAAAQTEQRIEIIVVVDGRDDETIAALDRDADARLVVHVPAAHLGNADARNAGVALARAAWVAFLDDDDEWLPRKLEVQLAAAAASGLTHPVVSCRMIGRDERGDREWPRRFPEDGEDLSEYFFCRSTPFTGEGMVINSGILTTRSLMQSVPFRSGLERHVDPDWMLRAVRHPGARMIFAGDAPLVIWNIEQGRRRITTQRDWRASLAWCAANRDLFTRRSYAAFVLHVVGSAAAAQGEGRAFATLLGDAFRHGSPAIVDVMSHVGNFFIPRGVQRMIAGAYGRLT